MPPVVDPEKTLADLTDDEQRELYTEVHQAWTDAEHGRRDKEEQARDNYRLYRKGSNRVEASRVARKGWSSIRIPLIYWLAETMLPRLGVNPPTVTVTPRSEDAVPFALSKQKRMNIFLSRQDWELEMIMVEKSKIVLGDGVTKTLWDSDRKIPRMIYVNWFDFFLSPDAQRADTAEWQFHRTYYTDRQLEALDEEVFLNLDKVMMAGNGPSASDATYADRRSIAGASALPGWTEQNLNVLVEAWHRDGSYITFSPDATALCRAQVSPFHDRESRPLRPFSMFSSTPDLEGPYSVPMPEILEDHEVEISTLRNQTIDQITANINAGVVHDDQVPSELVEQFMETPNGVLGVPNNTGDIRGMVHRMNPGQISQDMPLIYGQVRSESQMASGVSDISAGQQSIEGLENTTATGVSIIANEANKRMQLLLKMSEIAMGRVARLFDALDRQFGGALFVPTGADLNVSDDQDIASGFKQSAPGFAALLAEANRPEMDYEILIDAGSMQRPDEFAETQKIVNFVGLASHPAISPIIDWPEVTRAMIAAHGFEPDRFMLSPDEQAAVNEEQQIEGLAAAGGPPPDGAGPAPAPLEEPIGPPVAVA